MTAFVDCQEAAIHVASHRLNAYLLSGRMDINTVQAILKKLKAKVESGPEGGLYGDRSKARQDLDVLSANLSASRVKYLLAPTGNLQELSMECGWGDEFNQLAAELEMILGIA